MLSVTALSNTKYSYLQHLEARLANLENDVRRLNSVILAKPSNPKLPLETRWSNGTNDHISVSSAPIVAPLGPSGTHISPDGTDGVGSIEFTDEADSNYFGERKLFDLYSCHWVNWTD